MLNVGEYAVFFLNNFQIVLSLNSYNAYNTIDVILE